MRDAAPSAIRRILFVRTDRLGETVLNLPAVAALRAALPNATITLLVDASLVELLSGVPEVDEVLAAPPSARGSWWSRALATARALAGRRFDVAIVSNPKKELHLAVWLARIPRRVGYARKWDWLLTDRIPDGKSLGDRHEVEYNLALIRALGVATSPPRWRFPTVVSERHDILRVLGQEGIAPSERFLAVHPWTSNPRKQWPLERFTELIRRLAQRDDVRVVIIGAEAPPDRVQALVAAAPGVANLTERLSLRQLAGLLQEAQLLVSNDSGPVHLAAAVGTPVVALFGTSDAATGPGRWGPWGEGHIVVCRPTMDAIEVDEVLEAIRQILARPSRITNHESRTTHR